PAHIQTEVTPIAGGYRIRLTSPVLARSVYLSFGDLDAEPSDNYFDLLPNEPAEITVKTQAQIDALRQKLAVISLADAFAPSTVPAAPPQ
ncbi:MAG TPA: glycoside hydrolase family 2 protein, partial [Silvibacterium sp.]|nr:glycoside hydrolase family 2 protein [Silvibacterium sp.]